MRAQRRTAHVARVLEHRGEIDAARRTPCAMTSPGGGIAHRNAFTLAALPAPADITLQIHGLIPLGMPLGWERRRAQRPRKSATVSPELLVTRTS